MENKIKKKLKKVLSILRSKYKYRIQEKGFISQNYASLYYGLFDNSFKRQHFSILKGIRTFKDRGNANQTILIRNLHRLEKGLIMPKKKDVFGKEFIEETVSVFKKLESTLLTENKNLCIYSRNILDAYFEVNDKTDSTVKKSYVIYSSTQSHMKFPKIMLPFSRNKSEIADISYEEFLKLSKQRRSIRFFQDKIVERSLIERAVAAALQSPSACNRQPFRLVIADDPEFKNIIGSLPPGSNTYYKDVPVFIALIGDLSNYFSERDRHLIYIDTSLFAMSLMFALETLKLASCPINWPDIEDKEVQLAKLLNLKAYERCVMFIGLGYPDQKGLIPYSLKKMPKDIIQYNN